MKETSFCGCIVWKDPELWNETSLEGWWQRFSHISWSQQAWGVGLYRKMHTALMQTVGWKDSEACSWRLVCAVLKAGHPCLGKVVNSDWAIPNIPSPDSYPLVSMAFLSCFKLAYFHFPSSSVPAVFSDSVEQVISTWARGCSNLKIMVKQLKLLISGL